MNEPFVCILDYGSGNVGSVSNIFRSIAKNVVISNEPKDIEAASHLVLPGVGAFAASMTKINKRIPLEVVKKQVFDVGKPFLGICVGMQVLADTGEEFGTHPGLGWIPGVVRKIETQEPLPHVGWNDVQIQKTSPLTNNFPALTDFYFVHSFIFVPAEKEPIVATTNYGEEFCSIINKDNIFGVQFHPEKSQKIGKILLQNFLTLNSPTRNSV